VHFFLGSKTFLRKDQLLRSNQYFSTDNFFPRANDGSFSYGQPPVRKIAGELARAGVANGSFTKKIRPEFSGKLMVRGGKGSKLACLPCHTTKT
jgi:hypothetical protein